MADEVRKIRGLEKSFPGFHLGPLDMTVPTGGIYGLIGPNGAGKTTTIDLIMGMGREEAGTIEVFGLDHHKNEVAIKRQIGYISPDLLYNAWGGIDRLLRFVKGFYPDWDDAYCTDLLKRFRLNLYASISTLSFGERTKLGLTVALAHRPALLLLDEPQSGLDAVAKRELFSELLAAIEHEDHTVVISSNNLDDVERFADHLGMIKGGRILLEGPTAGLLERFCTADCIVADGFRHETLAGVTVLNQDGDRWRLLVDTKEDPVNRLEAAGATDIATAPVTLEDLFIALVQGD